MTQFVETQVFKLALWCWNSEPTYENKKYSPWKVDMDGSKNFDSSHHTADFRKFLISTKNSGFCWAILDLSNWAELGPPKYIFECPLAIGNHGPKLFYQLKNAPFWLVKSFCDTSS